MAKTADVKHRHSEQAAMQPAYLVVLIRRGGADFLHIWPGGGALRLQAGKCETVCRALFRPNTMFSTAARSGVERTEACRIVHLPEIA